MRASTSFRDLSELHSLSSRSDSIYSERCITMSVLPPYLSPAPTPGTTTSPADVAPPHAESSSSAQLRADQERLLLKLSQDLYEMEVCAGDVVAGQEDRVPAYL